MGLLDSVFKAFQEITRRASSTPRVCRAHIHPYDYHELVKEFSPYILRPGDPATIWTPAGAVELRADSTVAAGAVAVGVNRHDPDWTFHLADPVTSLRHHGETRDTLSEIKEYEAGLPKHRLRVRENAPWNF